MKNTNAYSSYSFGMVAFFSGLIALTLILASPGASDRYLPHGVCYAWQPGLIRLHLVSDVLIGLAYLAIPIALVHFIRARSDLPFNWMFLLFGLFIVACGATHWMEVWTLWNPTYWVAGSVKAVTAAASVPTAVLLFMLIPKAVAMPSIAQLEAAKSALEREIHQRREVESALEESRRRLEERVDQRTSELRIANELLERQRADLAHADRAKSNFLAILSHELRNPVHAIRTNAWVIKALAQDDSRQQAAAAIDRQVAKLSVLLEELLDVVSVSRNAKLELAPVDLRTIAEAAIETTRPDFAAKRQRVEVSRSAGPLPVSADPSRLEQAIANLLSNASKYTPEEGTIEVAFEDDGGEVAVSIRDNGIGIGHEDLAHLFQLFSRGSAAITRSQGLGVGLYIARELVVAHGGTIHAASAGPGEGCEFVIRLPRRVEAGPDAASTGASPAPAPVDAMAGMQVLVVDDNADAADSLAQMLRMTGHEVAVSYEGEAALGLARTSRFDVALIDIGLPTMSGYDIARALAGDDGEAPVLIAITGWGAEEDKAKAFAAGFARHLTKPVDLDVLLSLMDEIARARKRGGSP